MVGQFPHELQQYRVNMFEQVGAGSFGKVFKGRHVENCNIVALKEITWSVSEEDLDFDPKREIAICSELKHHKNIIQVLDHIILPKTVFIVMEYCKPGDLENFMKTNVPLLITRVDIMKQSVCGLSYLHAQSPPIIHRDLKLKNILLKEDGGQLVVKLTDFGSAKHLEETLMGTLCGTQTFWAPEILPQQGRVVYTKAVDIYSLGLVFLVILNFKKGDKTLEPKIGKFNNLIFTQSLAF